MYLICDDVFECLQFNCKRPLGSEKGEGKFKGRGGQYSTNQAQEWTSIRTTSFKRGIPKYVEGYMRIENKGCTKGEN
jgi:hypothetical protein